MANVLDQEQALPAPADGEADFASAFAERIAGEKQPDGPPPSEPESAPADSNEAPAEAAASGSASGFDPWGGLTPEQKSYFERVQQSERSQRGRIGALTKKLQGVDRAAVAPPSQPEADGGEVAKAPEPDDLDKINEEYGDVVGPLVAEARALRAEIASIKAPAASAAEVDASAEELNRAYELLERAHPDYAQIARDENFARWTQAQSEETRALASSYDPKEVALVLQLFKTERSAAMATSSGNGYDQGKHDGTATDDKRRRQLEGSRAVPSRGAPAAAGVPDDFSQAWKARAAQPR